MGKAPAFQFYVRDWLSDPQLRQCCFAVRGMWIDFLCYMWEAPEKGELRGTILSLGRLIGATPEEMKIFMEECLKHLFANVTCNGDVTNCNSEVTLKNRRMFREGQTRKNTKERVAKHRAKKAGNGPSNSEVTPPSSSSSSSSLKSSSLRSEDFSPAAQDATADPPILTLPILGGEEYPVTQAQVSTWSEAYPAVDVSLALRQMREWIESNPTKKRKNVRRFITNWLKREQEKGGNRGQLRPPGNKPQPHGRDIW